MTALISLLAAIMLAVSPDVIIPVPVKTTCVSGSYNMPEHPTYTVAGTSEGLASLESYLDNLGMTKSAKADVRIQINDRKFAKLLSPEMTSFGRDGAYSLTISEKQISLQEMPEKRENHTGYGAFSDVEPEDGALTSVLLGEYVIDHFTDFTDGPKGGELDYELEYILAGRESDKGNLETVAKKLVMLRFVPNYIYLQTSSTKQAEARAAAGTLCTLLAVPAVTEAAAQGILLAWAYGESVMDVRSLLDGQKAAITKDDTNWQLSLSGLMKLGTDEDTGTGMDVQDGMGYKDYMRMLLFLEGKERMSMRAMGIIEKNMQSIYGQPAFRIDYCAGRMEIRTVCNLRRGIKYQYRTYYGYQ